MTVAYIPLEINNREASSKILLSTLLAANDMPVLLGNKSIVYRFARKARHPGVMFYKSASPSVVNEFKRDLGFLFFGQDEEAGVSFKKFSDFYVPRIGAVDTAELTDGYFTWSNEEYDFLVKELGFSKKIIVNSGGLRTVLWGEQGKIFYEDEIDSLSKKKYLLFILTAPIANYALKKFENFDRNDVIRDEFRINLVKTIIQLILQETDYEVIVRPHPVEDSNTWKKLFYNSFRVSIVEKGSLTPLIQASRLVLHDGSTGAIESVVCGKPTIAITDNLFIFRKNPHFTSFPRSISLTPENIDELMKILENPVAAWNKVKNTFEVTIKNKLTDVATLKILNSISSILLNGKKESKSDELDHLKFDFKSYSDFLLKHYLSIFLPANKTRSMEIVKRPEIELNYIQNKIEKSKIVLGLDNYYKFNVKKVSFSTFLIKKII